MYIYIYIYIYVYIFQIFFNIYVLDTIDSIIIEEDKNEARRAR